MREGKQVKEDNHERKCYKGQEEKKRKKRNQRGEKGKASIYFPVVMRKEMKRWKQRRKEE